MTYIAATEFNSETWNKYGTTWLRQAKSAKLSGIIIGDNLPEDATAKVQELGFTLAPLNRNKYQTLMDHLPEGQRCLLTAPDVLPKAQLSEAKDVICEPASFSEFDVTFPIRNLVKRAKAIKLLRQKARPLVSNRFMLGTWDFWASFLGYMNYFTQSNYLEPRPLHDEAILNLYLAIVDSCSLEIKHG